MGISFTQIFLSIISFGLGYYTKARFEINQEETIVTLQTQVEEMKKDDDEDKRKLRYQLSQMKKARDFLNRDFLEFKEKAKTSSFNSIPQEKEAENSKKNVLKSFL